MNRLQNIHRGWSGSIADAVLSRIDAWRVRAAERRARAEEPDPENEVFDAEWARDAETPDWFSRHDRTGRIICWAVIAAAAVWMACGCIPR